MKLLHIDSSAWAETSVTRLLTRAVVDAQRAVDPTVEVTYRDLTAAPPDHLTAELAKVVKLRDLTDLDARQKAELALVDAMVGELMAADVVVIGAPMYNFTVPTQLKAWIDRIAQAGLTFRYTPEGPVGLATGKRVIVASSRGGRYAGTPREATFDHQEAYLRAVLGFLGMHDVAVVRAEGTAMGPDVRAQAIDAARREIDALFADTRRVAA